MTSNQRFKIKMMCHYCHDKKTCRIYGSLCGKKMDAIQEFKKANRKK